MEIFLVRHAEAVDETLALRDPHRFLTARGRTQAAALGERLRWHDCVPTHAWSSPLVRAVQTGELVIAALEDKIALEVAVDVAPDGSPRAVVAALRALPSDARPIVFGHEPGLSAIAALLVGKEIAPLAKAEAVRVDGDRVRWRFAWDAEAPAPG